MKEAAMFNRVAIIGLGLIGGSIGLALRNAKSAQQVTGYDLGKGVTDRARKIGAIDQPYDALTDAVRGDELIILATPVGAMRWLLIKYRGSLRYLEHRYAFWNPPSMMDRSLV